VARTVRRLRELRPDILIETLVGDFQGHMSSVDVSASAFPDVFAHNVEVVRRLTRTVRDVRSSYDQSLAVLRRAKEVAQKVSPAPERPMLTKSSIMVGLGETEAEVEETLVDLRSAGVDVVTIGQYLRPTPKHHAVIRFATPEEFEAYGRRALELGFLYAASGPLVRSSYKAAEVFLHSLLRGGGAERAPRRSVAEALDERLATARREAARVTAELGEIEGSSGGDLASMLARSQSAGAPVEGRPGEALLPASALVRSR
jgi:lipoic acid synthetase